MNILKKEVYLGDCIDVVLREAKETAVKSGNDIIFEVEFNGIKCMVSERTDLNLIKRDYYNAHTMNWKKVYGEPKEYSDATKKEIAIKTEEKRLYWKNKDDVRKQEDKDKYNKLLIDVSAEGELKVNDFDKYKEGVLIYKNDRGYKDIVNAAKYWGILMQVEINKGGTINKSAEACEKRLYCMNLSGFQVVAAAKILSQFWYRGHEFSDWFANKR